MKRILLVDDQEIANFIMKKILKIHLTDSEVHDFVMPEEAYDSISKLNPDIIFLDLNMPRMNGWEFLEKMKADNIATPVVILTSSTSNYDKERAGEFPNVKEFYFKPFNPTEITQIKEIIG